VRKCPLPNDAEGSGRKEKCTKSGLHKEAFLIKKKTAQYPINGRSSNEEVLGSRPSDFETPDGGSSDHLSLEKDGKNNKEIEGKKKRRNPGDIGTSKLLCQNRNPKNKSQTGVPGIKGYGRRCQSLQGGGGGGTPSNKKRTGDTSGAGKYQHPSDPTARHVPMKPAQGERSERDCT